MSWLDNAKRQLFTHVATLHGLEAIAGLVKKALVDPATDTYAVIQAVEKLIDALIAGFTGKISPEEINRQITALKAAIASNDAAADAALDAKFDGGGET